MWKLIDEILNAVLFLMVGVEMFAVAFEFGYLAAGVAAIALALVARLEAGRSCAHPDAQTVP